MSHNPRIAYECEKCRKAGHPTRRFILPGEPAPRCGDHGKMVRLENAPYRGAKPKE